ncbi:MAG: oligosaccharide flippase family protein [Syntrophales bacterium]
MNVIKKNIVANFGGGIWTGLMSFVFIPLYIKFMGIEAYGLVGVFATLLALLSMLDMGFIHTLNREMARMSVFENSAKEMRDLLRTLEIPYWLMAIIVGGSVIALSPLIAYKWVNPKSLSPATIQRAIIIMGLVMGCQWPLGFYSGGLLGLQRQVLLNIINAVMATFRGLGTVLILWLVSPTIEAFFSWQIIISLTHTGIVMFFLWHSLPASSQKPCFRRDLLLKIWRFAAGVTGITVLATILTQVDKVILSRLLNMEMFGYYTLAYFVAVTPLYRLISPVFSAISPRMNNLVALGDQEGLKKLYHKSAQLVSVLVLPAAIVVALFSKEILLLWTRDPITVERTHMLVSIIIIGTALNGILTIPYVLQLAAGWTRLTFLVCFFSLPLLIPLIIALTRWYGAVGAAIVWVILNGGQVLITVQLMHRRLLSTEKWRWYCEDVALPLTVALTVGIICRLLVPVPSGIVLGIIYLMMISSVVLSATALSTPLTRQWLYAKIRA